MNSPARKMATERLSAFSWSEKWTPGVSQSNSYITACQAEASLPALLAGPVGGLVQAPPCVGTPGAAAVELVAQQPQALFNAAL